LPAAVSFHNECANNLDVVCTSESSVLPSLVRQCAVGHLVAAQDMAATWLMHDLGASAFQLSFMATALLFRFSFSRFRPEPLPTS
jgi:hypothetical protein